MLAEAEVALGRGDRAAALASVRALFRPASPLWAAEDWGHAFVLAANAARGIWGARVLAALTAAAAAPSDPAVLTALGSALIDAGAADAATGVLWRAQLAAPHDRAALAELCHALELQGMHTTAVQFLEGARPTGFLEHHLLAVNALLARDRERAERARAGRPAPADEAEAALGRNVDAMLGRARVIDGASPLDAGDERGWWYVLTGGVLGVTPDDEAPAAAWLRAALDVWAGTLTMLPRAGRWLMTLDTPEARVLGRAASAVLGRPLDIPRVAGTAGLWAVADASTLPPGAQVAFRWHAPNQFVFAAMADRRLPLAWCPELIGLTARVAWVVSPSAEDAAAAEIITTPLPASAPMQLAALGRFLAAIRDVAPPAHGMRAPWIRPGPDAWTATGWAFTRTASGARALPCRFPATHPEVQERRPRASIPALDEALGWIQAGRGAHGLQLIQPLLERLRLTEDWRVAFQVLAAAMQGAGDRLAAERLAAARAQPLDPNITGAAGEAMAGAGWGHEAAAILAWTTALAPTTPHWLEAMCAVLTVDGRLAIVRRLVADLGAGLWIEQYWRAWEALRQGDVVGARGAWSALGPGDARRKAWLGTAITRLETLYGDQVPVPGTHVSALDDPRVRHWIETGVIAIHNFPRASASKAAPSPWGPSPTRGSELRASREKSSAPFANDTDGWDVLAADVAMVAEALGRAEIAAVAVPSGRRASQVLALAVAMVLDRPAVPAESAYSAGAALVVASLEELVAPTIGCGPRVAFWAERPGPQLAVPDVRVALSGGPPAFVGSLEALSQGSRTPPSEAAAELKRHVDLGAPTREAPDPVIVALLALTRAHPELGPRGGGRDPYGYWPGAPWPEFHPR